MELTSHTRRQPTANCTSHRQTLDRDVGLYTSYFELLLTLALQLLQLQHQHFRGML